jgi:hypothetical protein
MASCVYHACSLIFRCLNSEPCLLLCMKNLVCNNVELVNLLCNIMLYLVPPSCGLSAYHDPVVSDLPGFTRRKR